MPSTIGVLPSGGTLKRKAHFTNKMLTDTMARKIGVVDYHQHVRRALESIIHALDLQVGRQLLMTNVLSSNKGPEELFGGDRKPKIELYRTCIAAIPRLIPDGLSKDELVEHLSRLTVHLDNELRGLSFTALQTLVRDFSSWREDVVKGFVAFILKDIPDTCPLVLDSALRMLILFLTQWKTTAQNEKVKAERGEGIFPDMARLRIPSEQRPYATVLHRVEGLALVTMCSCRSVTRKLSIAVLKEVRNLCAVVGHTQYADEDIVMDVVDNAGPSAIRHWFAAVPPQHRPSLHQLSSVDLNWLADQPSVIPDSSFVESGRARPSSNGSIDPWSTCLAGMLEMKYLPTCCPSALRCSWPAVFQRMVAAYSMIDPGFNVSDPSSKGSVARGKKLSNTEDICLWRNYLVFACCIAPTPNPFGGRESPLTLGGPSVDIAIADRVDIKAEKTFTAQELFHWLVPLVRSEAPEMREVIVTALGKTNPLVFKELIDELQVSMKDALEKRTESTRKRRRRDVLRVYVARIFELTADHGCFRDCPSGVVDDNKALLPIFLDYIEGTKGFLVAESDKDLPVLHQLRLHFSGFIAQMVGSMPQGRARSNLLTAMMRQELFFLFSGWCGVFALSLSGLEKRATRVIKCDELQFTSLKAMSAVLCTGSVFEKSALEQQGYLYGWLDSLMDCPDEKVHKLGRKSVELLLMNNEDIPYLLAWVIDRCYTGSRLVQDCAFVALAKVFSKREYACDKVAVLHVVLYKTSDSNSQTRDLATQLLQTLDRRFFRSPSGTSLSGCLTSTYSQSQIVLSKELARAHPELTLGIFSEFSQRFESCPRSGQRSLLQYIVPWLGNIELVDVYSRGQTSTLRETVSLEINANLLVTPGSGTRLIGSGWGSITGSQLVLNNLFYITAKHGNDDFVKEVELLWASLCAWEQNISSILKYLVSLAGQSGSSTLLSHAKQVVVYLGRAHPKAIVAELMKEMQSVEVLSATIEKKVSPPFYKVVRAPSSAGQSKDTSQASHDPQSIRRRDRTGDSPSEDTLTNKVGSSTCVESASYKEINVDNPRSCEEDWAACWITKVQTSDGNPVPLPVPPGGGYYCPLVDMMPLSSQPTPLHRCNFALMLLTELVVDRADVSWATHLPLLLHVLFLGLDHVKPLVYEHCKRLLTNLVLVLACKSDNRHDIAAMQASGLHSPSDSSLAGDSQHQQSLSFSPIAIDKSYTPMVALPVSESPTPPTLCSNYSSASTLHQNEQSTLSIDRDFTEGDERQNANPEPKATRPLTQEEEIELQARLLIEFVTTRDRHKPLWPYEEITTRATSIKSTAHLEALLSRVLTVFSCLPGSDVRRRWAKVALQWATSCSSRHYAGRSFQICRALRLPLSWSMLVDILSRLVDSVGDPSPDVQGYVMEILLTLASAVDNGVGEIKYLDDGVGDNEENHTHYDGSVASVRRSRHSSRNQRDSSVVATNGSGQSSPAKRIANRRSPQLLEPSLINKSMRRSASTSFESFVRKEEPTFSSMKPRPRSLVKQRTPEYADNEAELVAAFKNVITDNPDLGGNVSRLRAKFSASPNVPQAMSCNETEGQENEHEVNNRGRPQTSSPGEFRDLLSKLFWVASAVLYSDYEHEFLMAVRLMNKVLDMLSADDPDDMTHLEAVLRELEWVNFPGVQCLLIKGLTSSATSETTIHLLARLTPIANHHVFTAYPFLGFPINVTCLLLHLGYRFANRDHFCNQVAETIEHVCLSDLSLPRLDRLFQLYREGSYERTSNAWISNICKYLKDAYCDKQFHVLMIPFLAEVLEFGPHVYQKSVLQVLGVLGRPRNLSSETAQKLNNLMQRIVARFAKTDLWEDAITILKQSIASSAKLPPKPTSEPTPEFIASTPWSVDAQSPKRERLPGPTLDVTVELSRSGFVRDAKGTAVTEANADGSIPWKKPQQSQRRTREKIGAVLKTCGHQSGLLHSSSVVFSDDLSPERQAVYSSSEEASVQDLLPGTGPKTQNETGEEGDAPEEIMGILTTEFDFLDDELDQQVDLARLDNPFGFTLRRRSMEDLEEIGRSSLANSTIKSGSVPSLKRAVEMEDSDRKVIMLSASDRFDSDTISQMSTDDREKPESTNAAVSSVESSLDIEDAQPTYQRLVISDPTYQRSLDDRQHQSSLDDSLPSCQETLLDDSQSSYRQPLASEFVSVASEEVESQWRAHVSTVLTDTTGAAAVNTYHLFAQLFKTTRRRVVKLTKESCGLLTENWGNVTSNFLTVVDILNSEVELPHVYTDTDAIAKARLLERHKFHVMEINENFNMYVQQRDSVMGQVENIKVSLRRMSVASADGSPSNAAQMKELSLCRSLYKLHFLLVVLLQSYGNLLLLVTSAKDNPQVTDMSSEFTDVQSSLRMAASACEWLAGAEATIPTSAAYLDPFTISLPAAVHTLQEHVKHNECIQAVKLLRMFRRKWKDGSVGLSADDDVDVLLSVYARYKSERRSGVLIITDIARKLPAACNKLMEANMMLFMSLNRSECD
ncbi:protein furry homolog-like isoform X2 [Corticium candelabrum]|nr:protein furry homolog-like isoform X2 [Corticium candelabrum]